MVGAAAGADASAQRGAPQIMSNTLSKADVDRLLKDPSIDTRVDVAAKVAKNVGTATLTPEERAIAEDIVRVLTRDAAIRVRQALAEQLKESRSVPHDVAVALARDVDAVSLPILIHSLVLSDEDLIEIIHHSGANKQAAIAQREHVSAPVAEAIVEADETVAVATLIGNDGAELGEETLQHVLDRHEGDDLIKAPLARRTNLPVTVLERLVTAASAGIRDILAKRTDLPADLASDLVLNTRERATVSLLSPTSPAAEALQLAQHLHRSTRLTPSLIIRAICVGDLAFVEAAFAVLAEIPVHNARQLIYDAGPTGFKAIYNRSRLPAEFFELFRIGIQVAQQTDFDGGENDRERHSRRTLERILTQYDKIAPDDLDYLLGKLRAAAGVARADLAPA
jgi:uncharacterized protein (DUF2336 family)